MPGVKGYVSGRVQSVGFRYFVSQHAEAAGLTGQVRNLADGRVEFVLQGETTAVQSVLDQIHRGPKYSRVDGVELIDADSAEHFIDFTIRR